MKYQDFTKKSYLNRAQWRYYLCEDIGVVMVTNIIFLFFIRILTFWNRKYKYYCLYFSFVTLYPSFITFLWHTFCDRWPLNCTILLFRKWIKKSCVLCWNFISIYKINRKSHGRLGKRILSSRAEILSALEDKIRIPRGHVISPVSLPFTHFSFLFLTKM